MPELPEVQTIVDSLNRLPITGGTITAARVTWPKTIAEMHPARFCRTIEGRVIRRITRRGKYIVMHLSGDLTLLIHLRMTGRLIWTPSETARNRHEHVVLAVDAGKELRFQDTRKFGRISLTKAPETVLDELGPEPLEAGFTCRRFLAMLRSRHRQIKPLLLDQRFLAGLGNIYVDEALWEAKIHPQRLSDTLTPGEGAALHRAIPHVLKESLQNMGTSLGSGKGNFLAADRRAGRNAEALKVFHQTGKPCPRCQTAIERIIVAQRSSHICIRCQHPAG